MILIYFYKIQVLQIPHIPFSPDQNIIYHGDQNIISTLLKCVLKDSCVIGKAYYSFQEYKYKFISLTRMKSTLEGAKLSRLKLCLAHVPEDMVSRYDG
jgi:hypothetical protein